MRLPRSPNLSHRILPFPGFIASYFRDAAVIWLLLRLIQWAYSWAIALRDRVPGPALLSDVGWGMSILLTCIAVAVAWFEHERSGENFFYSSLGVHTWMPAVTSTILLLALEAIF